MAVARSCLLLVLLVWLSCIDRAGAAGATFTFVNSCGFTVWVGVQSNGGIALLAGGGFELAAGSKNAVSAPAGWGGRFWGRTGCNFDSSGQGKCETGDCGGVLKCGGTGGAPPASLAEITLDGANGDDFYDISLVDGYNLPLEMTPSGGTGVCGSPGCTYNLNDNCPQVLQLVAQGLVIGCKSACAAFDTPEYCCTGAYGSPTTCPATEYSNAFKAACPTAYSYAYDDATSTFTCKGANYAITFCPNGTPGTTPSSNSTHGGTHPPPSRSPPKQSPPSPNGISQYGTGTSAGVRYSARVGFILLLCIAAFLFLHAQ
ncbi:hypothetical protein M758_5G120600 [Ceratodon purpureus]|nr:hypothetical protein M758_5G120600 [Ceratodon purpureus]